MNRKDIAAMTPQERHAYEMKMAATYRAQKDGPRGDALTEDGEKASSHYETGRGVLVRVGSRTGPSDAPEHYSPEAASMDQIRGIERRIEKLRADLAEKRPGFDPKTGEPRLWMDDPQRRAIVEAEIAEHERQLPMLHEYQQRAAAWREANVPTADDKLRAEWDHQQRVRERAAAIAEERQAQAMAERVVPHLSGYEPPK